MKRIMSIFFAIFMVAVCSISGGVLLAGCGSKKYGSSTRNEIDAPVETTASGSWDSYYASSYAGGSGTSSSPYLISTPEQLARMSYMINSGSGASSYYKLTADINISAHYWTPAAKGSLAFTGNFNGDNYCITGLTISSGTSGFYGNSSWYSASFFGYTRGATIQNFSLSQANITWTSSGSISYSAFVVSRSNSDTGSSSWTTIQDVRVVDSYMKLSGTTKNANMGGIAGSAIKTTIQRCCLIGCQIYTASGMSSDYSNGEYSSRCGGICGDGLVSNIYDCFFNGHIDVYLPVAGGIVGTAGGSSSGTYTYISRCYYVDVGTAWLGCKQGGGLIGCLNAAAEIRSCYVYFSSLTLNSNSSISGTAYSGKLIGYVHISSSTSYKSRIYQCFWYETTSSKACIGGALSFGTYTIIGHSSYTDASMPKSDVSGTFYTSSNYLGNSTYGSTWSSSVWDMTNSNYQTNGYPCLKNSYVTIIAIPYELSSNSRGSINCGTATVGLKNVRASSVNTTTRSYAYNATLISFNAIYGQTINLSVATTNSSQYTFQYWAKNSSSASSNSIGTSSSMSTVVTKSSHGFYYACFRGTAYTLSYNANGGSVSPSSKTVYYSESYGTLSTPTRTGYTFSGWYQNLASAVDFVEQTGVNVDTGAYQTGDTNWYTHSAMLSFKNTSGSAVTLSSNYTLCGIYAYDSSGKYIQRCGAYTTSFSIPSGTHYIRIEQNIGNLSYANRGLLQVWCPSRKITSSSTVDLNHNHSLIAHWTIKSYTLSIISGDNGIDDITNPATAWNIGGGRYVAGGGKSISVNYNQTVTISVAVKAGYTFSHWSDGNTSMSRTVTMGASNATYYAYTTPNTYVTTFNANGGIVYAPLDTWTFSGGATYNSSTGEVYFPSVGATITSPLIYVGDTNVNNCKSIQVRADFKMTQTNAGGPFAGISYFNSALSSYSGNGWATKAQGENYNANTWVNTGPTWWGGDYVGADTCAYIQLNFQYTSEWSSNAFYCKNVSIWIPDSPNDEYVTAKKVTYNSTYNTLPSPTRANYTFAGWWTSASGGTQVTSSTTYSTVGNTTLYAHWTPNTITNNVYLRVISKDGSTTTATNLGGSVSVLRYVISGSSSYSYSSTQTATSSSYTVHQGQTFRLTATANSGYVFAGFSTSSSPSASIRNPSSPVGTTATYYPTSGTSYYVYFKQVSGNLLKYDETDKYFYFEDGYYPQSEASGSESGALDKAVASGLASSESIVYNNGTSDVNLPVYSLNGNRYVRVSGNTAEWVGTGNNFYTLDKSYKYTDALTMNVWAYMDNWALYHNETRMIISCTENGGWNIENCYNNIVFNIWESGGSAYKELDTGTAWSSLASGWHMFTLTFDGSYAKCYLDGVYKKSTEKFSKGIGYNAGNTIFVGAEAGPNTTTPAGCYFKGKIKNVEIKNVALSQAEISQRYTSKVYTKWFKFEPIRWRISDYGVAKTERNISRYTTLLKFRNYTSYATDFVAVSDLILGVGAMNNTRAVREGDTVTDMTGFQNIQNTTDGCTISFSFAKSGNVIKVDNYSTYSQNNTVTTGTTAYSSPLRIASLEEINTVGFANKQARASDMVAFILGLDKNQVTYWTRDLSNLGSGVAITASGTEVRPWLDQMNGMRFAYTFSEGSNKDFYG